ncbi:MAG: pentapeptide repeat-containing protein [Sulfuricella sp.]|nr:pentapeptide repeat-containing protein [Sulfuricella sp.]
MKPIPPFLHHAAASGVLLLASLLPSAHATPPSYDSTSQRLHLPLVRSGEVVYPEVDIALSADGTWTLSSAGAARPVQDDDGSDAVFDAAGNTLTLQRVHVGGTVYGDLQLQLGGQRWQLGSAALPMHALSEDDFVTDEQLIATLDDIVVLNLEPASDSGAASDSGSAGMDQFPLQLPAGNYQFCFDAESDGADTLTLRDAQGTALLTLKAGDPCSQSTLAEGRYRQEVRHGGTNGEAHVVFVHQNSAGQGFAALLRDLLTLHVEENCVSCDLRRANLADMRLGKAYLTGSNLAGANLARTFLGGAHLSGANLSGANLTHAILAGADLSKANLNGADLRYANLSGATWTDGRRCGNDRPPYSGQCKP